MATAVFHWRAAARHRRQGPAAHEGKLAALQHNPADAGRETSRLGAVDNRVGNGKLTGKRFALGFIINGNRKAFGFAIRSVAARCNGSPSSSSERADAFASGLKAVFLSARSDPSVAGRSTAGVSPSRAACVRTDSGSSGARAIRAGASLAWAGAVGAESAAIPDTATNRAAEAAAKYVRLILSSFCAESSPPSALIPGPGFHPPVCVRTQCHKNGVVTARRRLNTAVPRQLPASQSQAVSARSAVNCASSGISSSTTHKSGSDWFRRCM